MSFRVGVQPWNPNQYAKKRHHEGHQPNRKPCLPIDENGDRRERERDGCGYRLKTSDPAESTLEPSKLPGGSTTTGFSAWRSIRRLTT
jgi:hypothetical protein